MAEEFKISQDEASKIKEAMKKPEFRKLLAEYAEEISDPENKRKYEEELIALERQRGVDMKYIHPKPGFVMKSFILPESTRKIFINICHNEMITAASSTPSRNKKKKGERWTIPYSLTPPREILDKSNNKCSVVDAVFNTETLEKGKHNPHFKQMLVDTVFDGLETQLSVKVDREKVVYLRMPYKGTAAPAVIRKKMDSKPEEPADSGGLNIPFPPLKEDQEAKSYKTQQRSKEKTRLPTEPKYTVLHRGEFTMQDFTNQRESTQIKRPKELVVSVELPGVESTNSVELDIFEKKMSLKSETPPYNLDLTLPYPIDEEKGKAKFDKTKRVLTVTLPVLPPSRNQPPTQNGAHQAESITWESATLPPKDNDSVEKDNDSVECVNVTAVETSKGLEVDVDLPCTRSEEENEGSSTLDESEPSSSCPVTGSDSNKQEPQTEAQTSQEDWSSKGVWVCPPFSYRQEESVVVFCLHTANAKEKSLVKYFEEHHVQLTYSTDKGEKYSFYVSFPEGCGLDVDDCSVDISEDNIVLLLKKDTPEGDPDGSHQWDKFSVGLNSSQTTEKLFLTTSNVESVLQKVDDLPDPWKMGRVWSDSATASVTSVTGDRLDIEISDPETERGNKVAGKTSAPATDSTSSPLEARPATSSSNDITDPSPVDERTAKPGKREDGNRDTPSAVAGGKETKSGNLPTEGSDAEASVKVEADGSIFIRGDSDYVKNREDIVATLKDSQPPPAASNKVKLSNKLLYSLD